MRERWIYLKLEREREERKESTYVHARKIEKVISLPEGSPFRFFFRILTTEED